MFLHPWALFVGLGAAALPVAIHLLTRPRPVRMPLSTLRFVMDAVRQRRARHRLRDALVLALRTLAVLALALAIARPDLGPKEANATDDTSRVVRVVIADVSQSLAAVSHGVQLFERGRPMIAKRLEYQSGLRANLILAGARPVAAFEQASSNFSQLREELAQARPRPEQCNVQAALARAAEVLAREGDATDLRREVVIVSDFQRTNWAAADFSAFPESVDIALESVAPEETLGNLAVLRVASQGRPEAGRETRVEVDVGNFSPATRNVRVDLHLGGASLQLTGACGPNSKTTLTGDLLPRETGWQTGEARLIGAEDALASDDIRSCVLDVRPAPRFALVTRQSEKQRPSSSYFLERALLPVDAAAADARNRAEEAGRASASVIRIDPAKLDPEALSAADLIIFAHPGKLSPEAITQITALVRRGRGLLYVAAEPVDATNLKLLTDAAGGSWKLPVEFSPPSASQARRNLFLAEVRREQSPFALFGDDYETLITPLRFAGGLNSRRLDGALADDIVAQFNDRSAFLVAAASDAGAVLVANADLAASNLPASPAFVPLVAELTQRMLGRAGAATDFACGEAFAVTLPSQISSVQDLQIAGPEPGASVAGELAPAAAGVQWRSESAGPPGVYRVTQHDQTVYALATAVPAAESDLRPLAGDVFQERLAQGRHVRFHSLARLDRDEHDTWWTWLAVACVAFLASEVGVLKLFKT